MPEATTPSSTSSSSSSAPPPSPMDVRYVKVASRFFRVGGGGGHCLGSCFLCKRDIACTCDVFMYKGDAAFCSDECRQEQMGMDEALETAARRKPPSAPPPSAASCAAPSKAAGAAVAAAEGQRMRRRPTIANLAARTPMVAG